MKKIGLLICSILLISACANKESKAEKEDCAAKPGKDKKFEMYKMSEMSALMEQMYVDNQRLKQRISNGETIGKFPNHFMKIHKAVMTDESENDAFFQNQAAMFIKAQGLIYQDPKNAKQHFNAGVDACIKCHEVKCSGPITRIKKLYIN